MLNDLELDLYLTRIMMEHSMFVVVVLAKNVRKYIEVFKEEIRSYQELLKN